MTTNTQPDLFTNVHKGIRRALFAACTALGRAEGDAHREREARGLLAQVLHFVAHHGENEEVLLLPILHEKAPEVFTTMTEAHAALDEARRALSAAPPIGALYLGACEFTWRYLAHMDEEERILEPKIRAVMSPHEIVEVGRRSVERTTPDDQRMMLAWVLGAMSLPEACSFLGRLPSTVADELRPLLETAA